MQRTGRGSRGRIYISGNRDFSPVSTYDIARSTDIIYTYPRGVISLLCLVALPFICEKAADNLFREELAMSRCGVYLFSFLALLSCFYVLSAIFRCIPAMRVLPRRKRFVFTFTDILLSTYLLYGIINMAFVKGFMTDPFIFLKWNVVVGCYALFQSLSGKSAVLASLTISGTIQACYIVGQALGYFQSNHDMFGVTGSFGNPGPAGGYLSVTLVASLCMLWQAVKSGRKVYTVFLTAVSVLMGCALLLTDSRAAVIASVCGVAVFFVPMIMRKKGWRIKIVAAVITMATVIVAAIFAYNYRPASADARLLVWRISADMIAEKPAWGAGTGAFDEKYLNYQADYFERNPDSRFAMVADNTAYSYNEAIHVAVEQGLFGLALLVLIFISVFSVRSKDPGNSVLKAALSALAVFSMFSYPSDVFALFLLFPVLIGSMDGKPVIKIKGRTIYSVIIKVISCLFIVVSMRSASFVTKMSDRMISLFDNPNDKSVKDSVDSNYLLLRHNAAFNYAYFGLFADNAAGDGFTASADEAFPSSETYCKLGMAYAKRAEYDKAEELLDKASSMVPARLAPNYCLFEVYMMREDSMAAIEIAHKILSQPLKVETTFTLRSKAKVRQFLENK